jgi:hypothetical protein
MPGAVYAVAVSGLDAHGARVDVITRCLLSVFPPNWGSGRPDEACLEPHAHANIKIRTPSRRHFPITRTARRDF